MRARVLLAVLALLGVPAVAVGHAEVAAVTDAVPTVTVVLTNPAEPEFLTLEPDGGVDADVRLDDDRRVVRVTLRGDWAPAPPNPSPAGELTLTLRVLSVDGHVSRARLTFAGAGPVITNDSSRGRPLAVAGDTLLIAGLLGMIGLIAIRCGILAPARRPPRQADPATWEAWSGEALATTLGGWWVAWWTSATLGLLGALCGFLAQLRALDIPLGDAGTLVTETRWGVGWLVQFIGIALAAALGAVLMNGPPHPARWWEWSPLLPLVLVALSLGWSGHAGVGSDAGLSIVLDTLHTVASGVWLGGLVALLIVARRHRAGPLTGDDTRLAAAIVVRFSAVAIACVATIMITGVYRGLEELRALGDLTDTGYGQALLVKIGIAAVLLTGGVYNRTVLHPRLERAALGLADTDRGAAQRLRVSVLAELLVAAVVLVAVAILVNLPPP